MIRLQIEPELRGGAEGLREEPSRLGRNAPLASNDLVDPLERDLEVLRQSHLANAERNQELLEEHLTGVRGNSILRKHSADLSAVVVEDAHVTRLTGFPPKHDSPLFVDANAVKSAKVAPKRLQAVARWLEEILKGSGGVQHIELAYRDSGDLRRDPLDRLASDPVVERLGSPIPERSDHRGLRRAESCPIHGIHAILLLYNGWALSCEPQRLRGSLEAPECDAKTVSRTDWNTLWLVSCSALLGGGLIQSIRHSLVDLIGERLVKEPTVTAPPVAKPRRPNS